MTHHISVIEYVVSQIFDASSQNSNFICSLLCLCRHGPMIISFFSEYGNIPYRPIRHYMYTLHIELHCTCMLAISLACRCWRLIRPQSSTINSKFVDSDSAIGRQRNGSQSTSRCVNEISGVNPVRNLGLSP